jgi:hypothetical protein
VLWFVAAAAAAPCDALTSGAPGRWDPETGERTASGERPRGRIEAFAVSGDARLFAIASDAGLALYRVSNEAFTLVAVAQRGLLPTE